ncbi:MAG: HAD-IA family hydrolase [Firmicutes bacterium]|nr:HAD-IA family hydrolase [Bacillota bacterium]
MNIKWIFFDLGSTLIDETEADNHRIRDMIEGTNISFDTFNNKRIEFAWKGLEGDQEAIKYFGLKKTPWHSEDETPFENSYATLDYLKNRGYKLGIIANQVIGTSQRLDSWGLLEFFDIIITSAELGVSKPNKLIFEKAFELSRCKPTDSVMVGDRLDNDINPAKSLGMKTVWIRRNFSIYQNSKYGDNIVDWVISDITDLKDIFI